jgi:hypothetical protein
MSRGKGDVGVTLDVAAVSVLGADLERFFQAVPQDDARAFNCNLKLGLERNALQLKSMDGTKNLKFQYLLKIGHPQIRLFATFRQNTISNQFFPFKCALLQSSG